MRTRGIISSPWSVAPLRRDQGGVEDALASDVNSHEVFMKGINHSHYYEGYTMLKAEEL